MALILDGNGLIQGLDAGGLPSGSVNADSLASTLDLSSKTMTFGNVSASGITFPATQSASSNANTLDDYEEGSWTPSLGGTTTYTHQTGRYVKIGRMVTVALHIQVNTIGTGSTTTISGLPFTSANDNTGYGGPGGYYNLVASNIVYLAPYTNNSSVLNFYSALSATGSLGSNAIFGNTTTVQLVFTYFVA